MTEYGEHFWEATKANRLSFAQAQNGAIDLSIDEGLAEPLRQRAAIERATPPELHTFWPGITCAGPSCCRMAVEAYFFCSEKCKEEYLGRVRR